MNRNFRSFIEPVIKDPTNWTENVHGQSAYKLKVPMSNKALVSLITLIPGASERARALNWATTDGLWQASLGREKLLKLVQEQADHLSGKSIPFNSPHATQNIQPNKAVAEMARSIYGMNGPDPFDQNDFEITVHDLFSKEAYQKLPILNQIRIQGLTIQEYYQQHFEPKVMTLSKTYVLAQLRESAIKHGMPPFQYGGFNGYIQWLEKGDWQKDIKKRSVVSPNDQYGINVAPLKEKNPTTGEMDTVEKFNKKGKPVYHFGGGSISSDVDRAGSVIHNMYVKFNQVAHAVETGQPTDGVNPDDFEFWKDMFQVKKMVDSKIKDPNTAGQGRQSYARQAGLPNTNNKAFTVLPPNINPVDYQTAVWIGLQYPFTMKANSFKNPAGFGPWVEDPKEAAKGPNGWHHIDANQNLTFSLNDKQAEGIQFYIFKDFVPEENKFVVKNYFNPANKNAAMEIPSLAVCQATKDTRFNTEAILNNGFHNDAEAKKMFKSVVHQLKDNDPSQYSYEPVSTKKAVYENGFTDESIEKLMDAGFEWKGGKNPLEPFFKQASQKAYEISGRQRPTPEQWSAAYQAIDSDKTLKGLRKVGYLTNGSKSLEVSFSKDDKGIKKWHLFVPNEQGFGKAVKPPKFGDLGTSLLAGGDDIEFSGGASDHVEMNKVGPKTWAKLRTRLLQGEQGGLGEFEGSNKGPFNNETELPCVRYGVNQAKKKFRDKHGTEVEFAKLTDASDYFGLPQLISWAVEALPSHSNDQAFQIGWIDQSEFDAFTGRDSSNKGKARINLDAEAEAEKQGERNGKGIKALLLRNGLLDGDESDEETKDIIYKWLHKTIKETHKDGIMIDTIWRTDPSLAASLARNGYEFRARNIGKYVLNQMNKQIDSDRATGGGRSFSSMGGSNNDGEEHSLDFGDDGFEGRGKFKVDKKDLSNSEIGNILGVQHAAPEDKPVTAKPSTTVKSTAQKPVVAADDDDDYGSSSFFGGKLKGAAPAPVVAAKAAPKPIAVKSPKPVVVADDDDDYGSSSFFGGKLKGAAPAPVVAAKAAPAPVVAAKAAPAPVVAAKAAPVDDDDDYGSSNFFGNKLRRESIELFDYFRDDYGSRDFFGNRLKRDSMELFDCFKYLRFKEMVGTGVVSTSQKPKDGGGWNWWGSPGKIGGTSITGDADAASSDPTGKKGIRRGSKRK